MSEASKSGSRWAVLGMAALLTGRRIPALGMFARGLALIEQHWRDNHPEFKGGFKERWDEAAKFYAATHEHPVNRYMHMAGIPLIVGGAVGLLTAKPFRPTWGVSAGAFAVGWGLNIAGHVFFEKNRPAFEQDPLSFFAGPVWDIQQLFNKNKGAQAGTSADATANAGTNAGTTVADDETPPGSYVVNGPVAEA
jgi:hypothetical protein